MTEENDMIAEEDGAEPVSGAAPAADEPLDAVADDAEDRRTRIVVFYLDSQRYALPIERVQEIQQIVALSPVPGGQRGVVGMVNLRGSVIPAVDLRRIVGLGDRPYSLETPMIICRMADQLVTLIVDEVEDVLEVPQSCLQDPSSIGTLADKMLGVARMADGLIYVLDIDSLLGFVVSGGR